MLAASTGSLTSANGLSSELANGHSNGKVEHAAAAAPLNGVTSSPKDGGALAAEVEDYKVDKNPSFEFGGSAIVTIIMAGFPVIMYYTWIGATYYDGKFPVPAAGQSFQDFLKQMGDYIYEGAYPTAKAWIIYWVFFVVEAAFYLYMPGVYAKGKPLPHLGGQHLSYYCSAQWSWYATNIIAFALHYTGIFPLQTVVDEFGPIMSVAILSGVIVSIVAYISALVRGAQHRMTGYLMYDFFMGAELNPRLFGWLDFKMFFEVRIPWYILYFISVGTACKQYEKYGYVTPEVGFLILAHFLYANACSKGEELIVSSWLVTFLIRLAAVCLTSSLGTCSLRNGALCSSFGILPAYPSPTAIVRSTSPTTTRLSIGGILTLLARSTSFISLSTGSGIPATARRTCSEPKRRALL
jgi:Delta24(24(1))-sterol reductase